MRGLKVTYFANASIPSRSANSVHIMKMCEALGDEGHTVTLRVPDQGLEELRGSDPFAWYGVRSVFNLCKARWMPRHPQGVVDLIWVLLSGLLIRFTGQADVCITRNPWAGLLFPRLGVPTVLELHAPVASQGRLGGLYRRLRAFAHPNLVRLVVISEALRTHYRTEGAPDEKIRVLHDAVDVEKYPEPVFSTRTERLRVGYIGSLNDGKGMEVLTALAARDLSNDYHVYGGSPADVARWRNAPGTSTNVTFHGHIPNADVPAKLNEFDVVLMPYLRRVSVSGNYGDVAAWMSPLKMFEYMAAGRAIVCSDLPVLREVLQHDRNALLADPDDLAAWGDAMARLADPGLRERLGRTARDEAAQEFTWRHRAKRILTQA
jgi:glycosyltransferase involved in cell wall biosynthesis